MKSFWEKLNKPFFVLAPLADVTDTAFRELIAKYSRPEGPAVFWTEFVSADGLAHLEARKKLVRDLEYTEAERPIVAQLFGSNPENMRKAVELCVELGFDGIDINMGCPDRSIEKQGAGAAHIKDMAHAQAIIRAAQEVAGDVPVSVKTRVGYNKDQLDEWIPKLLEMNLPALTIHARTRKEMSKVPARWEDVRRVVEIRDKMGVETLIIGNGDLKDIDDAKEKIKESGADGAMLGRAIFGNPWLFARKGSQSSGDAGDGSLTSKKMEKGLSSAELTEHLLVMVEHTKLFEKKLGDTRPVRDITPPRLAEMIYDATGSEVSNGIKNFAIMKKHYKAYVQGFDGAKELRMELMEAENADEVEAIVKKFLRGSV